MALELRVGMIGVNAQRGWAREAHAPAVLAVDGLRLAAVATRREDSAAAAAALFGVPKAYSDAYALIDDPEIDVVAVVSAVPTHHDLILAALAAGKHVITEWPVAVGTPATAEIARAAASAGLKTAVGLQARMSPATCRARALIADGRIGTIRTVRAFSTTAAFGQRVNATTLPLEREETGMNLTTIQTAHTLDLALLLGGGITAMQALRRIQYRDLVVDGEAATMRRTLPDQVSIGGILAGGGLLTLEVVGGRPADATPFRLEVEGTEGALVLTGGAPRGFQASALSLALNGERQPLGGLSVPGSVINVAGIYEALRDDIEDDTHTAPSFDDAVRLSTLIDDLMDADRTGSRVEI